MGLRRAIGIRLGRMRLGDVVEKALSGVGITEERVQRWLGKPCNCKERKEKMNSIGIWAARVVGGKETEAEARLEQLLKESEERERKEQQEGSAPATPGEPQVPSEQQPRAQPLTRPRNP